MVGHITYYRVVFDNNPRGIYFAGQTLSGVVTIFHRRQKRVNRILLVIIGRGRIRDTLNDTHRDYNFLRQEIVLADFMDGHLLTSGDYNYNFSYNLKDKLCPTFYGKKGFVHYEIVISLIDEDGIEGRQGMQYKHPFSVIRTMSMVRFREPHRLKPLEVSKRIDVCYCCCTVSKPYDITVQFPCRAFCPGDWLFIRLLCHSNLNEQLNLIKMKLMQNIKYTHMNGVENTTEQIKIAKVRTEYSSNLKGEDFVVGMKIPMTHATNEHSSPDLVTITYTLEVEVDLLTCCDERAHWDFDVSLHIQNLDNFTYDYCTHKKKKEVVTTQPLPSQTIVYPSTGWMPPTSFPQGSSPVYPIGTVPPKIGFDNVLRTDTTKDMPTFPPFPNTTHNSACPYPPETVPTITSKDAPFPPYPTHQPTSFPSNPTSSFPSNPVIDQTKSNTMTPETFATAPPQSPPTFTPPHISLQPSPKLSSPYPYSDSTPISNMPPLPSALAKAEYPRTPSNTQISSIMPTDSAVTLPSIQISNTAVTTASTRSYPSINRAHDSSEIEKPSTYFPVYSEHSTALSSTLPQESTDRYSPVYDQHSTPFTSAYPPEIIHPPSNTTRYSPIPLSNLSITQQSNTVPAAPALDDRTISYASTNAFEPIKPPSEILDIKSPLLSAKPFVETLDKPDNGPLDDSDALKDETDQLTQGQKNRKKVLGERKKKFQS